MTKIAVLVSGGGTSLQALIDAQARGEIKDGKLTSCLINLDAYALGARPSRESDRRAAPFADAEQYGAALHEKLTARGIGPIVLAGFMTVLPDSFCHKWQNQIINVHPSLIPSFCGEGFYGLRVHEAALRKGVKVTGATVHFVSEVVDGGAIILQKAVEIEPDDTPETLQKRVMAQAEHILLPRAVSLFCQGKLHVQDDRVTIE
ncbi:MAG: phosphoribosylglycinamide formyltransferase [Butyricicoccus pullicaecorum]